MSLAQLKRIKIELISKMKLPPIDIYLFIDNKMIKIISKESENYLHELKHYQSKNVPYVYVSPSDFDQMIKMVTFILEQKNKKVATLTLEIAAETFNFLRTKLLYMQVSPLEIEDMNRSLTQFVNTLSTTPPKFQDKLKLFLARKDYILSHSLMVSYVATLITKKLDWHSEQISQKVHFASIFKDIFLENPYLAKIRHLSSDEFKQLDNEQKAEVTGHMEKSISYLKQLDYLPLEVESMIRDHHELPGGTGFNRGIGSEGISPLGATFNLACFYCQEYLEGHNERSPQEIVLAMENDFNKGAYKQAYRALAKIIKGE